MNRQLHDKNAHYLILSCNRLTTEDVKKAMINLKNNKAAGTDGIYPEFKKYGGNKPLNRIYELVRQIWEEERIPEEWKETIIEIGVRITGE